MAFRFTIGKKIGLGFGIIIVFILVMIIQTLFTLQESRSINKEMLEVHSPSVDALQELKILIVDSKLLITNWAYWQSSPDNLEKLRLIELTDKVYPQQKEKVISIAEHWDDSEKVLESQIFEEVDILFGMHDEIKMQLSSFESYEDPQIRFMVNPMVEEGGDIDRKTKDVLSLLDELIQIQRTNSEIGSDRMIESFVALNNVVKYLGLALILGGILIAIFTVRSIVNPVQQLRNLLLLLGKGIIPKEKMKSRNDEIGEMSLALNDLVDGLQRTSEFANEVGSGNFESKYQPLSDQDTLGQSLLGMRKDLFELTSNLEQKVKERTETIEEQKKEIEILLKHTTDSIVYAKRIQEAILPPNEFIKAVLPESFFLYKPKDIVSGDFYWVDEKNGKVIFAAIDCTGHGVPGAFMTIIGHNGLNKAITEVENGHPSEILDALNREVSETFKQHNTQSDIKDGMDVAMCAIDYKNMEAEFAGAYNPLYLVRDGILQEVKGNKFPIGEFLGEEKQSFTNHKIPLQKGDTIYIFSDGYADQFGGPKGKKFMYRKFRDMIENMQDKQMEEQKVILNTTIEEWRGDLEQVDDIIVIGLRV
ncbi:MAG: hypothetical protein COA57_12495 [Flavobacteriales bacterium]|nr:SpoIIE family protein phosphatase [Bacteroidales bacterium AH-315-I05]PCJ82950.1 MAG: hypothetical protein COA57_12495 [Flavobacteriales bacterium]